MAETELPERVLNISEDALRRNIRNSLRFPQFQPGGSSGAVVICAAGPSLLDSLPLLASFHRAGIPICAVKGTADVLIKHGILPKYVVSMDGKKDQVRFFTNPHREIEYLISGQSHPKVFEALEGCDVVVWQGTGKEYLPKGTHYVLGGSTTGSRAVSLMWAKGFDVHHLVGFDCCEMNGKTHVYGVVKKQKLVPVYLGLKKFRTSGQMLFQYKEFIDHFCIDRRISVIVHGNGMLAEAWALLNRGIAPNLALFPHALAA